MDVAALEVDVDAPLVLLGGVLQPQLLAHLLHAGLDLLDLAGAVVPAADDDVEVRLASGLGIADARLEDLLGLLDELAVEVDGVVGHAARRVVLAEDVLGRLPVVVVHVGAVPLAFFRLRFGFGMVAAIVRLAGLHAGAVSSQHWGRGGNQLLRDELREETEGEERKAVRPLRSLSRGREEVVVRR